MNRYLLVKIILTLIILLPAYPGGAQQETSGLVGQPVAPNRYEGIKNSPYLFDHWVPGTIIPASGPPLDQVFLNFNGYTQNFEVLQGGRPVEVELGYFIGIRLQHEDQHCGRQSFLKYYHPKLINKYPLFVFNGRKHRLIKDFRVRLNENKVETPGKTEKFNSFGTVVSYFLMTGSDIELVRLNRKDVLRLFPSSAVAFVDAQQLDLETEQGLCQLLAWWDAQP